MNIKSITLKNFRGFHDVGIELKPLTVILGPNSAGKSSFGHALAALAHAHKTSAGTRFGTPISLSPTSDDADDWPIDLGKFDELRTAGSKDLVRIGLGSRAGYIELGFGGNTQELLLSYVLLPRGGHSEATEGLIVPTPGNVSSIRVDVDPSQIQETVAHVPGVEVVQTNGRDWKEGNNFVSTIFTGLVLDAVDHLAGGTGVLLNREARGDLRKFLEKLTYLRANRKRPSRRYKSDLGKPQEIGYSGEWAPSILYTKGKDVVRYHVPTAVPISTDEARAMNRKWAARECPLSIAVNDWMDHFKLAKGMTVDRRSPEEQWLKLGVSLENQLPHDITEVGFGVSQIVPVVIAGLLQDADGLFVVDLPEGHLHPKAQGLIADFFCSMIMSGKSALVETHSDMFFNRLRLRAAMNPEIKNDIAVYFIHEPKDGKCSIPYRVGLDSKDEPHWPVGFMQEGWRTQNRINAVRKANEPKS